ncbi:MAG TPA: hypothetical protein VHO48_16555, partial [Anaerolineaceae bacterium]|nr:hypothetical protein [Anaerolineaceae bacterium]
GYDGENFSYYEPVCGAESPCEPGEKRPGGKGLLVPRQKLLDAVLSQSKLMGYPWKYSFTLFEAGLSAADLRPIWRRNGQTTIGETRFGPQQGAVVIEELADRIEKNGVGMDLTTVRQNLEITASVREENARFLRDVFQGDEKIQLAASLYDQVIEKYRKVLAKTTEPIPDELTAIDIAAVLREAAAAERQIGTLFLEVGY